MSRLFLGPQPEALTDYADQDFSFQIPLANKPSHAYLIEGDMNCRTAFLLFFALILSELPSLLAEKIDRRNFAIDTYYPTANEVQLAGQRARKYWAKYAARFGSNPVYLAVVTSKIFPGEVQLLYPKLINSETTASFFGQRRGGWSNLQLKGIMIYDTRTGDFVGNRGFISVDTPPLGRVARFDEYIARYIGFGNWG